MREPATTTMRRMGRVWTPRRVGFGLWLVALAEVAAAVPVILLTSVGPASALGRAAAIVLVLVQAGSLWWMPRRPERAMGATLAAGIGLQALCPHLGVLGVANFALCVFAALRPPRISLWALGFIVAVSPWVAAGRGTVGWLVAIGGPVLSWSWGELLRSSRERRRIVAQRAVENERARIARELHDVVAHNVSLMVVQAVAAQDVFDVRPELSRESLSAIEASGRAALGELRRLLSTVRADGEDAHDPQPGLAQLEALVESVRAAGLDVALRREGRPVEVPSGVGLSAYRIVQEALTNTLRHAHASSAVVTVRYTPVAVEVEVADDGRGARGGVEGGRGIVGMRERAALLGGTLEVGSAPRGGFHVRAALPVGVPA
jgi:signal transduction histidine kinase